ncbi:MAG: site-specific integrase, partial [Rikenellaceae bacterium]
MKSTFSVIFYLKKQVVKKDGTSPVMGRITVDGSQTQFSCKLTVNPKNWDAKQGRATGRSVASIEANRMLDKIRGKIQNHYQEIMDRDNYVSAEKVKNAFLGLEHRQYTLMKVYEQFVEDYEKLAEAGMKSKKTLQTYKLVYKHLKRFLQTRYKVSDIALKELMPAFISDFDMYLRVERGCCNNTVWIYVGPLRTMISVAMNNGWLVRDPFREYEIRKEDTERGFLTKEEINLLINGKLKNSKQEYIRDLFLFCTFTGLSFADMRNLSEENIRCYFDDNPWIHILR